VTVLVEDETLVRRLTADILEDAGFRVIEAANASAALNWLDTGEDVQVLFTDVHMPPGIDGLELARRVHERWPEIRLGFGKTAEVVLNLLFNRSDDAGSIRFLSGLYACCSRRDGRDGFYPPVHATMERALGLSQRDLRCGSVHCLGAVGLGMSWGLLFSWPNLLHGALVGSGCSAPSGSCAIGIGSPPTDRNWRRCLPARSRPAKRLER